MRLVIHDFPGHPFQLQLSRALAQRGHEVLHLYCGDLPSPRGAVEPSGGDAPRFRCQGLSVGRPMRKYSLLDRLAVQRRYARLVLERIHAFGPDAVLSGNTPLDVQYRLMRACARWNIGFVHWIQDLYCLALRLALNAKLGASGSLLAPPFDWLERVVAERSDAVVSIADEFLSYFARRRIRPRAAHVVENWAPLDEIVPGPKANGWSRAHGLDRRLTFLYSGTMGLKHNPALIYRLARALGPPADPAVAVVSEGIGRDWLDSQPRLQNLLTMDFQPYDRMGEVLAAADVLVAVIDPVASEFSVPSKVLSYLCAGRAVLLAAPAGNLAARVLRRARAGVVVDPQDEAAFLEAARELAGHPAWRQQLGANARAYAETTFDIQRISSRFEAILERASAAAKPAAPRTLAAAAG